MNVYDFDHTIYDGDSTVDFFLYCFRRHPRTGLSLIRMIPAVFSYGFGNIEKTLLKERFFSFLPVLDDIDQEIHSFWDLHEKRIFQWYYKNQREDDVVISASPEFLLEPVCQRLGIRTLIASRVDKKSGMFEGKNCHDTEKVRRFYEAFPEGMIDEFYSDSLSDAPMAKIAKNPCLIKKGNVEKWPT